MIEKSGPLEPVTLSPVGTCLNVWASAQNHAKAGGKGHPVYEECMCIVNPVPHTERPADNSELTYDTMDGRYKGSRDLKYSVLHCIEVVERALKHAPDWQRAYLGEFRWPESTRFACVLGSAP